MADSPRPLTQRASHRPLMSCIPPSKTCLSHCFADGHTSPQARPDALTWRDALDEARDALVTCAANAQHRFGNHLLPARGVRVPRSWEGAIHFRHRKPCSAASIYNP